MPPEIQCLIPWWFRLVYLFRKPRIPWLNEEDIFQKLTLYAPTLSGIITALHMSEIGGNQSMFMFTLCCKSPFQWDLMSKLISLKLAIGCVLLCCLFELVVQGAILWKNNQGHAHQRYVVSTTGHAYSFLFSIVYSVVTSFYYLKLSSFGPTMLCQFVLFLAPSINFVVFPLIETLLSESLRPSFFVFNHWIEIYWI